MALPNGIIQKRLGSERLHSLPKVTQLRGGKLGSESRTVQLISMCFFNYTSLLLLETEKKYKIQALGRQGIHERLKRKSCGVTGKAQEMHPAC